MTFKQNLTELKSYLKQAPEANRSKIQDVIKLYEEKKILNIRTALNATILLSSKNKNTVKSGRPEREYQKIMTKYVEAEPMTGRLTRELEHELKLGDHEKVNTYIQIVIKSEKTDANGVETRYFKNIFAIYKDKLYRELMKVFEKKRSMKIRLRLGLKIFKQVEIFDGETDTTVKEIALRVDKPQSITKHNFKSVLETQKNIIEDRMDNINEIVGGSGWQVKKYTKLAIDIFETKPLRASFLLTNTRKIQQP